VKRLDDALFLKSSSRFNMAIKPIDGCSSPLLRYQADTSHSFQLSGSPCLTAQQQRWQMKLSWHRPKKNKPCSTRIFSIYCCSTTIYMRGWKDQINEGKGAEEDRGGRKISEGCSRRNRSGMGPTNRDKSHGSRGTVVKTICTSNTM
jgi:hypothetical protein